MWVREWVVSDRLGVRLLLRLACGPGTATLQLVVPVSAKLDVGDLRAAAALGLLVLLRDLLDGGRRGFEGLDGLLAAGVGEDVVGINVALAVGLGASLLGNDGGAVGDARLLGDHLAHLGQGGLDAGELNFALVDDLEQFVVLGDLGFVLRSRGCGGSKTLLNNDKQRVQEH